MIRITGPLFRASRTGPAPLIWLPASLLIVLCLVFDAGAATQTRRDITALQMSVQEMKDDIEQIRKAMGRLPDDEAITLIRENQTNLLTQVSELLRDVQILTGRFEESKYYMDKFFETTTANVEELRTRVDSVSAGLSSLSERFSKVESQALAGKVDTMEGELSALREKLAALEAKLAVPEPAPPAGVDEEPTVPAEVPEPPGEIEPEDEYESALATYNEEKYAEARALMEDFIKKHPKHSLAGNALYWIAETYYSEGDYDDAILSYEDLLQNYINHSKVPSALLKQAFAFLELGDEKAARGILQELISKFPDTEQAKTAKEKLSALEGPAEVPTKE